MSLITDHTHQLLTDQRERDLARLAETNRQVRLMLSGRVSWWRRLLDDNIFMRPRVIVGGNVGVGHAAARILALTWGRCC